MVQPSRTITCLEATPILMKLDSTEILPESLLWLPTLVRDVERGFDLARAAGSEASVEVVGHTDLSGDEQRNDLLSARRAESVRDLLIERGLPAERLTARGVAARDFSGDPSAEGDLRRNRRVDLRLRIGSAPGGPRP